MTCLRRSILLTNLFHGNIRIFFIIFLSILLLLSETTVINAQIDIGSVRAQRYIILFDTPSVMEQYIDEKNNHMDTTIFSQSEKQDFMEKLLNKVKYSQEENEKSILSLSTNDEKVTISSMLTWFFNGCIIETDSDTIITSLQYMPGIKQIIPDESIISIQSQDQYEYPSNNNNQLVALQTGLTGKNVTMAIFDTGVDYTHPALEPNYLGGYDFVNNDIDPFDDHGHGTHVSGIAVGRPIDTEIWNGGIAPDAKFYSYKVMDNQGVGSISSFLKAFEYALDPNQDGDISDKVDIISISAGDPEGTSDDLLSQAADTAVQSGIVVVAAAGNSGPEPGTVTSPGIAEYAISVGAASYTGDIASFSSRGIVSYGRVKPDVIAPGVQITSTWLNEGYTVLSGTSMATPYVAGYCARILEEHPQWSPLEIAMALRKDARSVGYDMMTEGHGFLDIAQYVSINEIPPISWIHSAYISTSDELTINGHIQGSDIVSYQCLLRPMGDTIEWSTIRTTVSTSGITGDLAPIDISSFNTGSYLLQLQVSSNTDSISDYYFVEYEGQSSETDMTVIYPERVDERSDFSVHIQTLEPTMIITLFLVPFRAPQIKIGSDIMFKAPILFSEDEESVSGRLFIITPGLDTSFITKKSITIENTNIS